ncbi:hypothetical protein EZS27_008957 [termite gut metagenome]|uniref:Glycosyltransferase subfamily 4-like N-terminal domain-containing protein n=1 Tax=termite gut metagenome TaxID=433724 RepID=A0A5J4SB90_9ZZZZ
MLSHVCFFISSISNSEGTERITTSLANSLIKEGYNVSIISLCQNNESVFQIDSKIQLYILFKKPKPYPLLIFVILWKLCVIIHEKSVDMIINVDVILALFTLPLRYTFKVEQQDIISCRKMHISKRI